MVDDETMNTFDDLARFSQDFYNVVAIFIPYRPIAFVFVIVFISFPIRVFRNDYSIQAKGTYLLTVPVFGVRRVLRIRSFCRRRRRRRRRRGDLLLGVMHDLLDDVELLFGETVFIVRRVSRFCLAALSNTIKYQYRPISAHLSFRYKRTRDVNAIPRLCPPQNLQKTFCKKNR